MSKIADDAAALVATLPQLQQAEQRIALGMRTPRMLKHARGSAVVLMPDDIEGNERRSARGAWLAARRKERQEKRERKRAVGMKARTATRDAMRERIAALAANVAAAAERSHIDSTDLALFVKTWNAELFARAAVVAERVVLHAKDAPPPVVGIRRIDILLKQVAESGTFQFFSNPIVLWILGGALALVAILKSC